MPGHNLSHLVTPGHIWSYMVTPVLSVTPGHIWSQLVTPFTSGTNTKCNARTDASLNGSYTFRLSPQVLRRIGFVDKALAFRSWGQG